MMSDLRRPINETIGFLTHFKADAEAGIPCQPDTIQMVIDRLRAVLYGSPTVVLASELRGNPPALKSAIVVGLQAAEVTK
jgi:hypothetical protein